MSHSLSYKAPSFSPVLSNNADFDPHSLLSYLSPLKLWNLLKTLEDSTKLEYLLANHHNLYQYFVHFQSIDWTIWCLKHVIQKLKKKPIPYSWSWKWKGSPKHWLCSLSENESIDTNHIKFIDDDNDPPNPNPSLSLNLLFLLTPLHQLQNCWPLITLHLPHFLL